MIAVTPARRRDRPRARVVALAGLLLGLAGASALADPMPVRLRASVAPGAVLLGERVTYRGQVAYPVGSRPYQWLPPEPDPDLTWGSPVPRLARSAAGWDTLYVEVPLQVFRLGAVAIPGLRFRSGEPGRPLHRLPNVTLFIRPVLTAADSNADLRPPRGPLAAPWWERVPWRWVVLGVGVLAGLVALVVWLRRRKRRPAPAQAPLRLDPAVAALAELEALRKRRLPAQGLFAEHAFQLTRILRCYLEAVVRTPRPGHTSAELVAVLERAGLGAADVERIAVLLRGWDRVKFARAAWTPEDCIQAEGAVEALIRQVGHDAPRRAA
jgi:hypothetical protein